MRKVFLALTVLLVSFVGTPAIAGPLAEADQCVAVAYYDNRTDTISSRQATWANVADLWDPLPIVRAEVRLTTANGNAGRTGYSGSSIFAFRHVAAHGPVKDVIVVGVFVNAPPSGREDRLTTRLGSGSNPTKSVRLAPLGFAENMVMSKDVMLFSVSFFPEADFIALQARAVTELDGVDCVVN